MLQKLVLQECSLLLALRRETCDANSLGRKDEQSELTAIELTTAADPLSKALAMPKHENKKKNVHIDVLSWRPSSSWSMSAMYMLYELWVEAELIVGEPHNHVDSKAWRWRNERWWWERRCEGVFFLVFLLICDCTMLLVEFPL